MNTETLNLVRQSLASVRQSLAEVEKQLSAQVLDGTPYLVGIVEDSGQRRIYGEWGATRQAGFIGEQAVPCHLCGAVLSSEAGAVSKVRKLAAKGEKAFFVHRTTFLANRLPELTALAGQLESALSLRA
jgi:hypothetical protein